MWLRSLRGAAVPLFLCLLQSVSGGYLITWQKLWFEGSPAQICIALDEMPLPTDALTVQVLVSKSSRRYPNYPEFSYSGGTAYVPEEVIDQLDLNPENEEVVLEESLTPTPGTKYSCLSLLLPELPNSSNYGTVRVNGTIHGARIDETRSIRILYMRQSFLQTDKEKYKPGQKVQFRVLTLEVPNMKVSTEPTVNKSSVPNVNVSREPYSSIYINDPKGTRIKQWLNVPNTAGLIHLEYQLFDEQKEGSYSIIATTSDSQVYKRFKVEKYVLPRFEVTLDAPGYALASDDTLEMEVCAQYTFGEPVKGNLAININNGRYGSSEREVNFVDELMGCKSVEIPLSSLRINYLDFVYRLRITVEVEEEGTGVVKRETASIPVKRTALRFERLESRKYPRLELPYFSSLRVTYNDGDPAKNEPMTVCTKRWVLPLEAQRMRQENGCYTATSSPTQNSSMTLCPEIVCQYLGTNNAGIPVAACLMVLCRNMTTDDSGVLRVTIPPHLFSDSLVVAVVEVTASNYPDLSLNGSLRNYMYKSSTQVYLGRKPYFSPSNSSLLINVDYRKLSCTSGSNIQLELPVLYTASDPEQVTLYVQVVSWGLIQTSMTSISLSGSAIEIDDSTLIEQMMPPSSPNIRRGAFTLPLTLPPSVSPGVRILIWYTRPDGEVVSDEQPLEVSKCLNYAVELSWPDDKVEFGTEQPLTVTAQPNALCSIGVVDKSVELLSAQTSLIDQIFFMPPITSNVMSDSSQIDDFAHCIRESCRANLRTADRSEEQPSLRMIGAETSYVYPSYSFTSKHVDAIRMFDDAGLFVISDHTLETRPCTKQDQGGGYPYNPYGYGYGNVGILGGLTSGLAVMGGGGTEGIVAGLQGPTATGGAPGLGDIDDSEPITPAVTVKTRAYFPETWLWELQTIPPLQLRQPASRKKHVTVTRSFQSCVMVCMLCCVLCYGVCVVASARPDPGSAATHVWCHVRKLDRGDMCSGLRGPVCVCVIVWMGGVRI
ncbi:Alpha-2-macroglobulin N-terminal 2 [Trinorchestia longiramus]|nr:Alpha-2-macroglobulin N-terminal 2 [Trinorchestia longiramus]